jgi:hypothetical protein
MPYIKRERRMLAEHCPQTAGELNYAITMLIKNYSSNRFFDYQTINDVRGALEGAKLEYERRVAVDYEIAAIERNGDVY